VGGDIAKKTLPTDAPRKAKQSANIKLPINIWLVFCVSYKNGNK